MQQSISAKNRQPLTENRLWNTAEKSDTPDGHWIWIGSRLIRSYGACGIFGKETAHRAAYRFHYGSIPPGLDIKHTCGNTLCIRPSHLIAASHGPQKGAPIWNKGKKQPRVEIFERHVIRTPNPQCWGWNAYRDKDGYAVMTGDGKPMHAQRFSYELHCGPIPKGMFVLHHCDNPTCTKPEHLFLGNTRDNALDASRKGRLRSGAQHPRGNAKLIEEQILRMRSLRIGLSLKELAKLFNISRQTVGDICMRRTWTHI